MGKPSPTGHYTKTNIRIPQIARWRLAGINDDKIAEMLGLTKSGIQQICKSKEYKDHEEAVLNGHISEMDKALSGNVDAIRREFRVAVPAAMRCVVDAVTQRKDLRTALQAAEIIFKRDPDRTLSEVSDAVEPGLPQEVLDAAVAEGNAIATAMEADAKKNEVVN